MKPRLVLVLGDQLSLDVTALRVGDPARDVVVMAEAAGETAYVPHHPKKIALVLAAMRKFAARLQADGWTVAYTRLDDAANTGSISGESIRRASGYRAEEIIATTPGEWQVIGTLEALPLQVRQWFDKRFVTSHRSFARWAEGR